MYWCRRIILRCIYLGEKPVYSTISTIPKTSQDLWENKFKRIHQGSMIRHGSTPLYPQETMGSLAMFGQNWCDFLKGWLQDDSRSSGQVDILTLKRREI